MRTRRRLPYRLRGRALVTRPGGIPQALVRTDLSQRPPRAMELFNSSHNPESNVEPRLLRRMIAAIRRTAELGIVIDAHAVLSTIGHIHWLGYFASRGC